MRDAQCHRLREDDIVVSSGMASQALGHGLYGRWRHRLKDDGDAGSRGGLDDSVEALRKTQ
jgi:hypothetical protein